LNNGFGVIFDTVLLKPVQLGNIRKNSSDRCLACSGSNHITVSALTKNRRDGINYDGFTGTGFTGKNIKSTVKGNVRAFNDRDILNMQKTQHGNSSFKIN
jgi:hypothetical protein